MKLVATTAGLTLVIMLLFGASPAMAHQQLLGSSPAAGETLDIAPGSLHLRFAEPVDHALTTIELFGPGGASLELGELRSPQGAPNELLIDIRSETPAGTYTVRWRTTGRDGHPVSGEYAFTLTPGTDRTSQPADSVVVAPEPDVRSESAVTPPPAVSGSTFQVGSPAYVALRWIFYLALFVMIGACVFTLLVLPLAARHRDGDAAILVPLAASRATALGLGATMVFLLALFGRLYAQSLALFGEAALGNAERLESLLRTSWGTSWLIQAGGVLVVLLGFATARGWRLAGVATAALGLITIVLAQALTGHAAALEGRERIVGSAADAVHVLAGASWLGTLFVLILAGIPAVASLGRGRRALGASALVAAFSPVALTAAAALVATGLALGVLHVGSFDALTGSRYGATLLIKLTLVVLLIGAGAYNFLVGRKRMRERGDPDALRVSAGLELAITSLVLLVTAVLVATARP